MKVEDEFLDEAESIADDDERELIGELGFFEEVLDLFGVVVLRLAADAFDFADLTGSRCRLNVFEVDLGVLAEVDDRAEIVVEACVSPVIIDTAQEGEKSHLRRS